ncbi:MAG: hypothetical protein EOO02_07170 [Chitinophagaceae bacterium]|nr:MAG: hypothetical protein EOO02_07170 [Chitinophagaceae bacterium]
MKIPFLLLSLMLIFSGVIAQRNKDVFTFYDSKGAKTTDDASAAYFSRLKFRNDTTWRLDVYDVSGPLINSISFSDKTTKNKNGIFSSYHPNGFLESTGDFKNNKRQGTWLYCDTAGKYMSKKEFWQNCEIIQTATDHFYA